MPLNTYQCFQMYVSWFTFYFRITKSFFSSKLKKADIAFNAVGSMNLLTRFLFVKQRKFEQRNFFQKYLSCSQFWVWFLELIPDGFQNGRKGRYSNSTANQHADVIVKHILTGSSKRAIHCHSKMESSDQPWQVIGPTFRLFMVSYTGAGYILKQVRITWHSAR